MSAATHFTIDELAALGVRRISLGGTLARVAWTAVTKAVRKITEEGKFDGLAGTMSNAELNAFFKEDVKSRQS
jgi:2-methylisocitrate lyase-like PEP mutase family enzyme